MLFKWTNDKGEEINIYKLNPTLRNIKGFHDDKGNRLSDTEMRFVMLVADAQSPCRLLAPEKRRASAVVILGLTDEFDKPNEKGNELILGQNKLVERAINTFREHFVSRSDQFKQEAIETNIRAWNTQREILEYADKNKLFDKDNMVEMELSNNDVKILAEGNKIIKDGLQQKLLEQIEYYEKSLDKFPLTLSPQKQEQLDQFQETKESGKFSFDRMKL